jgi:acetyl-CoA/propionyl-CoA carboxylase, biotin carboxylase, biotin carboxyl carrier protein
MLQSVLIANRGEIAVRIQRTLRRLGIESIAVYSDADARAPHVLGADRAVRLGPAPANESYLDVEKVIAAAKASGAQAVHPGYGFLSERADFARACLAAGLVFVGPGPKAIALLGDKAAAKQAAAGAGVPVVPGLCGARLTDQEIIEWASGQQLPVLLKAAGGGGGRGMRVVRSTDDLPEAIIAARREAGAAFGDQRLIVERYVERARHIEVQVIADAHGNVLHLGERECSLQRRHQKVIEEAPSPVVDAQLRQRLGEAAVTLARACGYINAGTVELIADRENPSDFCFLEMNARLQVEHPVTELVTGLDLVELQLRVAAGEPLGISQQDVKPAGHAIEARLYAEDPAHGFLPSAGRIVLYREPREIRIDSGIAQDAQVTTDYDPMLAKAIAHGPDRATALRRLKAGLRGTRVLGPTTNLPWLLALLDRPEMQAGEIDTTLIERIAPEIDLRPEDGQLLAGLAAIALLPRPRGEDPWEALDGWSPAGRAESVMRLDAATGAVEARFTPLDEGWQVEEAHVRMLDGALQVLMSDGQTRLLESYRDGDVVWILAEGVPHRFSIPQEHAASHAGSDSLRAPMPGVVLEVRSQEGEQVREGEVLVVLESMKMELSVASPEDGIVAAVHVRAGDRVAQGQPLLEMEAR